MNKCFCLIACIALFFASMLPTPWNTAKAFQANCVPFNSQPKHHNHDSVCGPEGDVKPDKPASQEQNRFKNNLCRTGTPVKISLATLENLHKAVVRDNKFKFGSDAKLNQNVSRDALISLKTVDASGRQLEIGEGQLVSLEAFVLEAKHDDIPLLDRRFKGESVNCHDLTPEGNDIHVALVETSQEVASFKAAPTDKQKGIIECRSVTAEIIPHLRPDTWNRFDSNPKTAPAVNGLPVQGLRVRITGQLFFDGSHDPANCAPPRRRSSWEIHPVYTIEVRDGNKFISFDEFAAKQTAARPRAGRGQGSRIRRSPQP